MTLPTDHPSAPPLPGFLPASSLYRTAFHQAGVAMLVVTTPPDSHPLAGTLMTANHAGSVLLGHDLERLRGLPLAALFDDVHASLLFVETRSRTRSGACHGECRVQRADGTFFWGHVTVACAAVGEDMDTYLMQVYDVSLRRAEAERWRHLAERDPLTALFNRRRFLADVILHLSHQGRAGAGALALLDLDDLKVINDTYGHAMGDRVLVTVAQALTAAGEDEAIPARLGGDEFALFLPDSAPPQAAAQVADITAAASAATVPPLDDAATLSAGVSGWQESAPSSVDVLLRQADSALYQAKRAGRGRVRVADAHASSPARPRRR